MEDFFDDFEKWKRAVLKIYSSIQVIRIRDPRSISVYAWIERAGLSMFSENTCDLRNISTQVTAYMAEAGYMPPKKTFSIEGLDSLWIKETKKAGGFMQIGSPEIDPSGKAHAYYMTMEACSGLARREGLTPSWFGHKFQLYLAIFSKLQGRFRTLNLMVQKFSHPDTSSSGGMRVYGAVLNVLSDGNCGYQEHSIETFLDSIRRILDAGGKFLWGEADSKKVVCHIKLPTKRGSLVRRGLLFCTFPSGSGTTQVLRTYTVKGRSLYLIGGGIEVSHKQPLPGKFAFGRSVRRLNRAEDGILEEAAVTFSFPDFSKESHLAKYLGVKEYNFWKYQFESGKKEGLDGVLSLLEKAEAKMNVPSKGKITQLQRNIGLCFEKYCKKIETANSDNDSLKGGQKIE